MTQTQKPTQVWPTLSVHCGERAGVQGVEQNVLGHCAQVLSNVRTACFNGTERVQSQVAIAGGIEVDFQRIGFPGPGPHNDRASGWRYQVFNMWS
jgi:hypothetical protein